MPATVHVDEEPKPRENGNRRIDMQLNRKRLLTPVRKRKLKASVHEVVFIAILLGATRNLQLVSTLEREFRIQGNRHTQTVVTNAKIRRRSRHRNFYAHSNSPHFVST